MHKGSCLCGAIHFTVEGDLPKASACHCTKCRKHTGHYEAGIDVPKAAVAISGEDRITWFQSSEKVRRGFCSVCGSSLFFDPIHLDWIGLMLGSFDGPTNTRIALHIFVADKGDYYDLNDGVPQNLQ
ncbi:aldehyde-activating protein [Devosia epidermidihirudinis]|uniref:Aldehyde-activating protein n=1 Tax=Devosia epidermidihirudinis TaxID=1293439 RepID=A0A0F5Q791_9HYPH|nr:GFA family protein [Devosia epidermidihirudinis]KKC36521.1 aldehyde-activating protein [Devosia epidermidihirudinis]